MKKALITGITGQDGSYLAELLLEKGYEVHGLIRRSSMFTTGRIMQIFREVQDRDSRLFLHYGDLLDAVSIFNLVKKIEPDEIYNLAAQSHVRVSFDIPIYTTESIVNGTLNILEAIRSAGLEEKVRYYQASSSEMYGRVTETPQKEETRFRPQSPYACAKVFAHHQTINYREGYNIHASCGILFNHESPRRGETFVTRKITRGIAKILCGQENKIFLGNLEAKRDWGYAKEYVEAMWLMLQQEKPDDYVIATGKTYSVHEFLELCFSYVDLDWREFVSIDERYYRPTEVDLLLGDASKAKDQLGWTPKVDLPELVSIMMDHDLKLFGVRK